MAGNNTGRQYKIKDAQALGKLNGVQLSITEMEERALEIRRGIPHKQGVVQACAILQERIINECIPINNALKTEPPEMEPDEARIRTDVIKKIAKIVADMGAENTGDMINLKARAEGLKEGADKLAERFHILAQKYEHQERIANEDEESEPKAPRAKRGKGKGRGKGDGKDLE